MLNKKKKIEIENRVDRILDGIKDVLLTVDYLVITADGYADAVNKIDGIGLSEEERKYAFWYLDDETLCVTESEFSTFRDAREQVIAARYDNSSLSLLEEYCKGLGLTNKLSQSLITELLDMIAWERRTNDLTCK